MILLAVEILATITIGFVATAWWLWRDELQTWLTQLQ